MSKVAIFAAQEVPRGPLHHFLCWRAPASLFVYFSNLPEHLLGARHGSLLRSRQNKLITFPAPQGLCEGGWVDSKSARNRNCTEISRFINFGEPVGKNKGY